MSDNQEKNTNPGNNQNPFNRMRDSFGGGNKKPGDKKPKFTFSLYWIYAILAIAFIAITYSDFGGGVKTLEAPKDFYQDMLLKGHVEKVVIVKRNDEAEIYLKKDSVNATANKAYYEKKLGKNYKFADKDKRPQFKLNISKPEEFEKQLIEFQKNNNIPEGNRIYAETNNDKDWGGDIISIILPIVVIVLIWMFIMRRMGGGGAGGGQIFNIGKSKATLFDKDTQVNITFDNVAGLDEAKVEIKEIVDFLKQPKKYTSLGGKIPRGALLIGPPGTGKTLLAKAVAGEAQVPFFSLSGSDFVEMFVGVGASRVRDLFRQAKEKAPCIIFIDEIDAIGRARGRNAMQGANDERENTLNQLLTEMDGFGTNNGVIILAATNRADILDRALLRPGRFDRQIFVDLPDLVGRREIFKVHLKPLKLDPHLDLEFLAKQTPGFSGADIANVCNEAALIAARKNKDSIGKQDFLDAVDRIIGGLEKKNKIISKQEKEVIAYHEAGHAATSWLLRYAHPLLKVTIVPRGRSLGAAWYLPEERQITTTEQLMDEMVATLGGRAAEEVVFGKISTGALSDLEKVTKQAYAMVTVYGLNAKLGNISYYDSSGQEYSFSKPYSEKRSETIDDEVSKMIEGAYETAKRILTENKDKLTKLAETLLEKEVIFREDLEEIFGKRPFGEDEDAIEGIKGDYNAAKIEEEAKLREQGKKEEAERLDKEKSTNEERPRDLGDTFVQPPPPKDEDKPEDKQEV
jgi:ATP-dependent metalloprotease FtsH